MRSTLIAASVSAALHLGVWMAAPRTNPGIDEAAPARLPTTVDLRHPPPVPGPVPGPGPDPKPHDLRPSIATSTRRRTESSRSGSSIGTGSGEQKKPGTGTGTGTGPESPESPESKPDLFSTAALGVATHLDLSPPTDTGWRPKRGVGGRDGRGGVDVGSFLAEDAARHRVEKGVVAPRLRDLERRLDKAFDPPFAHVDVANKLELLHKQFMGRLGRPPKLKDLSRGDDPTRETYADKVKKMAAEPFFLGRRVEVFVRQRADGSIIEMALRQASGFHAFDDECLDAVEKAVRDRPAPPEELHNGEIRTLWRLEATAYVVYSPTPSATFDESTGKIQLIYPLEKRVDRKVQLMATY